MQIQTKRKPRQGKTLVGFRVCFLLHKNHAAKAINLVATWFLFFLRIYFFIFFERLVAICFLPPFVFQPHFARIFCLFFVSSHKMNSPP